MLGLMALPALAGGGAAAAGGGGLAALLGLGGAAASRMLPSIGMAGRGGGASLNLGGLARDMMGGNPLGGQMSPLEAMMNNVNYQGQIRLGGNQALSIGSNQRGRMYDQIMQRLLAGDTAPMNANATTGPPVAMTPSQPPMPMMPMGTRGMMGRMGY
ncbi:MAG: hypothetical protein ACKV2Q_36450 [Planctomycetaceae bacterium]